LYTHDEKDTTGSDNEKADVLADYFSSVFTLEPEGDFPAVTAKTDNKLHSVTITPETVEREC
jgi:hypothetical protein